MSSKNRERELAYWMNISTPGACAFTCDSCKRAFVDALFHPITREIFCQVCFEKIIKEPMNKEMEVRKIMRRKK